MGKSKSSVSVIIPVFNQELYIGRCLRSLFDQSLEKDKYEIVVIDDGSKDKTKQILKSFGNQIKILTNNTNKGLPYSLNKGIKAAKGRFIVRVDSDDYVNREFLNILQMYLLYNTNSHAVSCDYYLVNDKEEIIKRSNSTLSPIGCAIMFRLESLISIGMYDKSFLVHEDKELRIRFTKKYKIDRLALPLYRYRKHSDNITNNLKKMRRHYKKLIQKHKR